MKMGSGHNPEDCKQIFALLSDYLDAELPVSDCEELRKHIADCPPCIEFLESLKKTITLCHDCPPYERPSPLSESVKAEMLAAYRKALESRHT